MMDQFQAKGLYLEYILEEHKGANVISKIQTYK